MGRLAEYIKLVKKGVSNIDKVAEGYLNEIKLKFKGLSEDEQEEIARRRLICTECPLNSRNAQMSDYYLELYGNHYKTDRGDFHCSICTCPIGPKTASLSSNCGLEDYNETNPKNIQPLKWTAYDG